MQPPHRLKDQLPHWPDVSVDIITGVRPDWRSRVPAWRDCDVATLWEPYLRNLLSERRQHEFIGVVRIDDLRPTYEVPGRRNDGTPANSNKLARAAMLVARRLRNVILSTIGIVVGLLLENPQVVTSRRYHMVRGHEGCQALAFMAPVTPTPWTMGIDSLWLVWSGHQAVLFKLDYDDDPEKLEVLWEGTMPSTVPYVDLHNRALKWRDDSSIVLDEGRMFSNSFHNVPPHPGQHPAGGQQ